MAKIVRTEIEASGGVKDHNVRYVLRFGTVAVIIAFAASLSVFFCLNFPAPLFSDALLLPHEGPAHAGLFRSARLA